MQMISSRQNPVVREFRDLASGTHPTGTRLLLDGVHLVRDAQAAGVEFEAVAVSTTHAEADAATEEAIIARELESTGVDTYSVTTAVMDAISPVRTPSGIVAIARRTPIAAPEVCARRDAFVIAAVDVQDPGNLGSLLRAAEAGGASGVLVCGASANPFSWKGLRGSMGSALRLPVAAGLDLADALRCAALSGARLVASVARGGADPDRIDWRGPVMLLLGGEGGGLSEAVAAQCDERVTIPMAAPVESLNVAVAGAVLVYAARRQRA
jgi:RNA methyltransferase, TrmH family